MYIWVGQPEIPPVRAATQAARVAQDRSRARDRSGPLGTARDRSGPLGTARDRSGPLGTARDRSGLRYAVTEESRGRAAA